MKKLSILFILMNFLCGCQYQKNLNTKAVSPIEAITQSASTAPQCFEGIFEFKVKSTDSEQSLEFLNSELDNHDQRNLTVALRPSAVKELTLIYGDNPMVFLLDKNIRVEGEAKRVKTWVLYKNKNIKRYYYRTKVFVKSADQLTVL